MAKYTIVLSQCYFFVVDSATQCMVLSSVLFFEIENINFGATLFHHVFELSQT